MPKSVVGFGSGIYYPAEAARLLGIRPGRLRRWVRGYTYWSHETRRGKRHKLPPVLSRTAQGGDLPVIDRSIALSFLELMELRVVRKLVDDEHFPLQHVRRFASELKGQFQTNYPFASRQVFAARDSILATLSRTDGAHFLASTGKDATQLGLTTLFSPYLTDSEFDDATFLTKRWWPLGENTPVVLDPRINFGAPTIDGRRVRTAIVAGMVEASSELEAARAYELSIEQVRAACSFEQQLKSVASAR